MRPLLYGFHGLFWAVFGLRLLGGERVARAAPADTGAAVPRAEPRARLLVALHGLGFGLMYAGVGQGVFASPDQVDLFAGQPVMGASVILAGAALAAWALLYFRSWRLQAKLEAGHQLATGGPFAFVRNPIYLAFDLLAIGSFLWMPNGLTLVGVVSMAVLGDVRGRAEERLLEEGFGEAYRTYRGRVKRFVPFLY